MGEGTYDWRRWNEFFRSGILDLKSTDLYECINISCSSIPRTSPSLTESWKSKVKVPVNGREILFRLSGW